MHFLLMFWPVIPTVVRYHRLRMPKSPALKFESYSLFLTKAKRIICLSFSIRDQFLASLSLTFLTEKH